MPKESASANNPTAASKHHFIDATAAFDPMKMMDAGKPAETPMEAWISLFPTSPLFGVRWAMWDLMRQGAAAIEPTSQKTSRPSSSDDAATAAKEAEKLSMGGVAKQPSATVSELKPKAAAKAKPAKEKAEKAKDAPKAKAAKKSAANDDSAKTTEAGAVKPANLLKAPPARIDDLKAIKGVGPRLETRLNELGIYKYDQIAAFDEQNFAWLDENVAALFRGRGVKEEWADQAKTLLDSK